MGGFAFAVELRGSCVERILGGCISAASSGVGCNDAALGRRGDAWGLHCGMRATWGV